MLSKEQLLIRRFKAINEDTSYTFKKNDIFTDTGDGLFLCERVYNIIQESTLKYFPHLFKELFWFEERSIEDMPQYYHYSGNNGVFKTNFRVESASGIVMLQFEPTETLPVKLEYTNPATEQEYNDYIKTKK